MRNGESESGKFRILVRDSSESFAGNGIKFEDPESARSYGRELASRWFALRAFAVVSTDLDPDINGSYYSQSLIEAEAIGEIETY